MVRHPTWVVLSETFLEDLLGGGDVSLGSRGRTLHANQDALDSCQLWGPPRLADPCLRVGNESGGLIGMLRALGNQSMG